MAEKSDIEEKSEKNDESLEAGITPSDGDAGAPANLAIALTSVHFVKAIVIAPGA